MKKKPTLIIFTGLPGTGKTSISRKVAAKLTLPLLAKDTIKEIMFDELGWDDKALSVKFAHATFKIMDYVTEQQLRAGQDLILESNYMPRLANAKFQTWQAAFDCRVIQIVCRTELNVLAHRYHERSLVDRHPGHQDTATVAYHRQALAQRIKKRRGPAARSQRESNYRGHHRLQCGQYFGSSQPTEARLISGS